MYAANLVKLCFPEPPTPTNKADDLGIYIILEIFNKCVNASSNNTRSIFFYGLFLLNFFSIKLHLSLNL